MEALIEKAASMLGLELLGLGTGLATYCGAKRGHTQPGNLLHCIAETNYRTSPLVSSNK